MGNNKKKYPYDDNRVHGTKVSRELVTPRQLRYIHYLTKLKPDEELNEIMDCIPGDLDIEDLTMGQGSWVIGCLVGDIKSIGR